jgi:uncharacterized protein (DUF58 family)
MTTAGTPVWRTTASHTAGVVLGVVLLGTGLVTGRADVALLGLPALASAAWGRAHRPEHLVEARLTLDDDAPAATLSAHLHLDAPDDARLVHVRVAGPVGAAPAEALLAAHGGGRTVPVRVPSVRTGAQETFHVDLAAYGPEGVEEQSPGAIEGPRVLVLPRPSALGRVPLSTRLRGLSGPHVSRRPGDGSELRDISPFRPGDRTRRIDWRTTARRSPTLDTLYVRRTYATAEATVVLVVDSRDEVGPDLTTWGGTGVLRPDEATSLDLARHAAASVAAAVVDAGDRVALEDLGRQRRPIPPGGGRRHLRRLVHGLALARPVGAPASRHRPPQVPAGSAVYLFSTLLDDEAPRLAASWHESGHRVVVVDTLPVVDASVAEPRVHLAWRITRMERDDRVLALRSEGIDVVRWVGAGPGDGVAREPRTALEVATLSHERHHHATGARR